MTLSRAIYIFVAYYFNPHSHEGSDQLLHNKDRLLKISIHTPTKGVTTPYTVFNILIKISIHTPTKGVTNVYPGSRKYSYISIHTPTKGVTRLSLSDILHRLYFNPHSHEGSDAFVAIQLICTTVISIHTPTKGVT